MSFPSSSSKSLTSTPLKSRGASGVLQRSRSLESDRDSTSSLLSPIYHDSFELSDEEEAPPPVHDVTSALARLSPSRNDDEERFSSSRLRLNAWEQWVVEKAKEERVKKQQKAKEELMRKEKEKEKEEEQQKKKVASDCKIQEWLRMKHQQEIKEKLSKQFQKSQEQLQEEKRRAEVEKKAQEKYTEWLRKKKQEEAERKMKGKEEAERRGAEERERREKAEESFNQWLHGVKTKQKLSRQTSASSTGNYNNLNCPTPSFVNPVPWKPIHVPQQERTPRKPTGRRRATGAKRSQSVSHRPRDGVSSSCRRR